ncbi:uncharacterized protein LOC143356519 [Halictus rubicundus]|uniref:uncharacterized protein LOC143356519 n=1 Tax=Halictus rubicundus TaxID=77578 RepID=UPI004035E59C
MHSITARLDSLNQQLMIISKLQKMEEEFDAYPPYLMCKKNNFGQHCRCVHHFSLEEQCDRLNYIQDCISCNNAKKRVPCNAKTCKTRKRLLVHKSTPLNEDYKKIDTHEEKGEQTIPTKEENFHLKKSVIASIINNTELQTAPIKEKLYVKETGVPQDINDLTDLDYDVESIPVKDDQIQRIQEDLLNERKRNEELEKKLESLTCSMNCLKEDSEQKAACLKNALTTAEEQAKVAMNLVKQSTNQVDLVKTDRNDLLSKISKLQQQVAEVSMKNAALTEERNNLKQKLDSLSEDESKRCEELELEVNRMRSAVKEKEDALDKERAEFTSMISELTNMIKIQKRRLCEVTGVCNDQQYALHKKHEELSQKSTELLEVQAALQSNNNVRKEMQEQIEHLKECLCEESKACQCMKQELEIVRENHSSELRIKEKIVEEQNKTITRQRKLLHDSEEMAHQVASEFDQLREELCQEKEKCKCLQIEMDKIDSNMNKTYSLECEQCKSLRSEIDYLKKEKQRALTIAKFSYQKLNLSVREYQKQLICQREQHRNMELMIERKDHEIVCLKTQIYQYRSKSIQRMNNYVI